MEALDNVKPIVLMVATSQWFPAARLAVALGNAISIVDAICPPYHPLRSTSTVRHVYTYSSFAPLKSLLKSIKGATPDLIIPCDDLATRQLHLLYEQQRLRGGHGKPICDLIQRSLGSPESFPIVYARAAFMRAAQEAGVRVPQNGRVSDLGDLKREISRFGFPLVLKSDGSSGGRGVRVVQTLEEAQSALRMLQAPPLLARAAKRALLDRDRTLIWPSLLRRRATVSAQTFITGQEATSTVACWQGEVLAALHFEVVRQGYNAGPATVMRLTDNVEMASAVARMVRQLNLSGLHGFDFMLESNTRHAYLIEINPRTTQVGHLQLGMGRDLPAALLGAVSGRRVQPAAKATDNETIALFPQEWIRDPSSSFLSSGYHDVPWNEPELLLDCIRYAMSQREASTRQRLDRTLTGVLLPRPCSDIQQPAPQQADRGID
jgi:Carbamoyl-phosphate synthase L chain, ATP binding domain